MLFYFDKKMFSCYTSFDIAKKGLGNKWNVVLCTDIKRQEELILEGCKLLICSGIMKGLKVESIQEILKDMPRKAIKIFAEILTTEKRKAEKQPKKNLMKFLGDGF